MSLLSRGPPSSPEESILSDFSLGQTSRISTRTCGEQRQHSNSDSRSVLPILVQNSAFEHLRRDTRQSVKLHGFTENARFKCPQFLPINFFQNENFESDSPAVECETHTSTHPDTQGSNVIATNKTERSVETHCEWIAATIAIRTRGHVMT